MKNIFSKAIYPVLILVLIGFLAWKNYTPGTILSGWDTLHPEFNFSSYLNRTFFGAWQEHQGIGAPAAQAHAAELARLPIVYFLSLVIPLNMVRYSFFFLTWAIGALGVYFLAHYFLSERSNKHVRGASFLGAVFYLLNLATLQQYFDPLEMFAVHFATLPWLILLTSKFLKEGKKKNLIWFSVVTLFSSSMAHTATLFYVYFIAFFLFILIASLLSWKRQALKRGVFLVVLTVLLNFFWLGPNIYYVIKESATVSNSKISRTFSDEAFLQSRAFGNLKSLGILKNFPFNWREYDFSKNSFENLMRVWDDHLAQPRVKEIGYGTITFALFGIAVAALRKSKYALALLPALALSVFFWLNGVPREIPLLREALRFPFTKFSILIISTLSVFLAYSSQLVMEILGKIKLGFIFVFLGACALIYFMLPAFKGNFIDNSMKVKIPNEYFEVFKWFDTHDHSGRIAKLPMQTFWDWNFYSWGYQGGGFTWFGIPQPTLDREFDRWGLYNQDFYTQASNALYGNDPETFINTLKKYQVKYLLLDESVINPGGSSDILYIPQIKDLISKSETIKEVAKFGFLTVYETNIDTGNNFVSAPKTLFDDAQRILIKKNLLVSENLSVNRGFPKAYNCDIKKIGTVFKENSKEGIMYKADGGGVSCDYLSFSDLKYNQAYILRIAGENREGRSLKIYLTNYKTGRADLEELMPSGKFDKEFSVFPTKLIGSGYSLNFETRSFGKIASENLVAKVEIYDATLQEENLQGVHSIQNNLRINNVRKYGTWGYKIDTEGDGLLQLGQGFEDGWIALQTQNSKLITQNHNLNFKILEHVKVNNWANGWKVEASQFLDINSQILVIYWPQLLEWGGLAVGAITLLILVLKKR